MTGALGTPTYRRFLLAQILSVFGSGLTTIALGLLAFEMAGAQAGAVLGVALGIKMVAYVGLAPIAAALAAHLPRRAFLIGLDLARACLVLVLPFVSEIWHIYVLVFGFQAFSAAFTPTFQAIIPEILKSEEDYTQALSFSRLTYDLEALLGPLAAGLLLVVFSFDVLFVGTALGFLASAGLVLSVTLPAQSRSLVALSFRKRVTRGSEIYLKTPRLRGVLALYLAVAVATAMVIVNTVVQVKQVLGLGDEAVALYFAASGLGSMCVALVLPRILGKQSPRTVMLLGGVCLALVLAMAAFGPGAALGLVLWVALGAGASLIQTPTGLLITRSCHPEDRPAVFAAQFALSHSAWLLAYPLAGVMGANLGLPVTFAVMSGIAMAATICAMWVWPKRDPARIMHSHSLPMDQHPTDLLIQDEATKEGVLFHSHEFVIDDAHLKWPNAQRPTDSGET